MFLVFDYCNEKSTLFWGAHWSVGLTGLVFFLFSCYSHQSISDYSWEVYIIRSGVFAG